MNLYKGVFPKWTYDPCTRTSTFNSSGGGGAGRKKQQAIYMNVYREIEEIGLHDYEVQVLSLQDRSAVWRPREELQSSSKAVCWQNSLLEEISLSSTQAVNWLDETYLRYGEQQALLKAHWFKW